MRLAVTKLPRTDYPQRLTSAAKPPHDQRRQGPERTSGLIVLALSFLFDFDWLVEDEIGLEDPFSHRIFACLIGLWRTRNSVGSDDTPVLPDDHLHLHREMLCP